MGDTNENRTLKRKASSNLEENFIPLTNHRIMTAIPDDFNRVVATMRQGDYNGGYTEGYRAGYEARRREEDQALVPYQRNAPIPGLGLLPTTPQGDHQQHQTVTSPTTAAEGTEKPTIKKVCARCRALALHCSGHYPCKHCEEDGAKCQVIACLWNPCYHGAKCYTVHMEEIEHLAAHAGRQISIFVNPTNGKKDLAKGEGLEHAADNMHGYKGARPQWMSELWFSKE